MKSLIVGVVLIVVIGLAGFLYRNVAERTGGPQPVACTMEAKECPDGSFVGRVGPSCEFAPCPAETALGTVPETYVTLPAGYVRSGDPNVDLRTEGDMTIHREFTKASLGTAPHVLRVHALGVDPDDVTIEDVEDNIVRNTVFSPSDMQAESIDELEKTLIAGETFYAVVIERFEGMVHSRYYLPLPISSGGVNLYRFDLIEQDVVDWMNPDLVIADLPEHRAFLEMLSSLRVGE